uniref:Bifunctional inhibitor/plant lipid transfer protein/seed storage helical domain-containing protein n=1 Tax=Salix viminalis TaxID=40686 RepID=A0A6N2K795_SALVM
MGSKNGVATSAISCILVLLMLVGSAESDFQQDRAECANQLVGLAACLPYVGGDAKAPTLDCCSGLKQVVDKSEKCLCVLIKNRDNPDLGVKFNVSLVAKLPSLCQSPVNVTECISLLHLPANSPDAKVFEEFANITQSGSIATPVLSGNSTGMIISNPSSADKANRWFVAEIVCGSLLLALTSFGF